MNDKKTLVIGSLRHDHVTSVPWTDLADVNVLDFHSVVLFLPSLDHDAIEKVGTAELFNMQRTFAQFLVSDGDIYVLGAPPLGGNNYEQWSWCPIPIRSIAQQGDTIERNGDSFSRLLSRLKTWDCTYQIDGRDQAMTLSMVLSHGVPGLPIRFDGEWYARNRAGGLLAARFWACMEKRNDKPHVLPGSITVLPHFPGDDAHDVVSTALVDILGKPQSEGVPEWLSSIPMRAVDPIDQRLLTLRQDIAALERQVNEQLAEKARLERYKRLLYVSSFELEDLVAECLGALGASITPARYSQEEFVMEWNNSVFLAECKGVSKSISLANLRQVQDYVLKYEEDENSKGKGILFGNAWRGLPPAERDTKDRPIFPPNVIERAQQFGVSLVSTLDLYHAFSRFLSGEVSPQAILSVITEANGVADFSTLVDS
ncbi:hypothetical protein [Burkholderia sp. ISTR5]|uniref:hypothetical protein n=1 Tax=Burkholderia sp. ISTR5 TaxID=2500161 RepID=UPI0013696CCD|nr:hypothetical protein [Burkholderia sp. ISTR5]NBI48188.1 hypothetical protein [Burkholderia sp. ISTR5]